MADRGFADCKLFYALTEELTFEYVIRLRGDIYVTNARGERRPAAAWVGAGGCARRLVGARVTDAHELPVGAVHAASYLSCHAYGVHQRAPPAHW